MNQVLVPVLLLATAAVSSSNLLPLLSTYNLQHQRFEIKSQKHDNIIFNNRQNSRSIRNNVLYKIPAETPENGNSKSFVYNTGGEDNQAVNNYNVNENDNYNGKGFRKDQWHNYPRQLDRLHNFLYEQYNIDKRNLDPDDPTNAVDYTKNMEDRNIHEITNEFLIDTDGDTHNIYDAFVATTNPLLILKIKLACPSKNTGNTNANQYLNGYPLILEDVANDLKEENENNIEEIENIYEENPILDVIKVKRKTSDTADYNEFEKNQPAGNKAVTKRIFSLWSRLQSLNHRGHELLHRRHLHAFYGMPDSDGSGVLTAETRATLMRPPGSPLRWG